MTLNGGLKPDSYLANETKLSLGKIATQAEQKTLQCRVDDQYFAHPKQRYAVIRTGTQLIQH